MDANPLAGLLAGLRLGANRVLREVHDAQGCRDPDADVKFLLRVADWDGAAALARRHDVAGLFLHGLDGVPELAKAPVAMLRRSRSRRVVRAAHLLKGLNEAARCLDAAEIPCIALKGAPLGQRLYGHPWLREPVDIDMLVAPHALRTAEEALLDAGWQRPRAGEPSQATIFRRYLKHVALTGPDGLLELHRQLFANPSLVGVAFQDLWARRDTVQIGAASFAVLGTTDDILFTTCHGMSHGWRRLKWLCDVGVALSRAQEDPAGWDRVRARFRSAGKEAVLESAVLLCRRTLHLPLPAPQRASRRAVFVSRRTERAWSRSAIKAMRQGPNKDSSRGRAGRRERIGHKAAAVLLGTGIVRPALAEIKSMTAVRLASWAGRPRIKALRTFARVPVRTKGMALEAAFFLMAAKLLVRHVPMTRWRRWIVTGEGREANAGAADAERRLRPSTQPLARKVGRVVTRVAEGLPFEAVCLPQAMAAQWMLRRRGTASRLFYGFRRLPGSDLELHAWLAANGEGVVGHREAETYCAFPGFDDLSSNAPRPIASEDAPRP